MRPDLDAAAAEHASFRTALDVPAARLDRLDLVTAALPEDVFDRYDGFVVGGSPFNVTNVVKSDTQRQVERDLERDAENALQGGRPAFFTCFGIGVMTGLLGGVVTTDHPEQTSAAEVRTTPEATRDPLFAPAGPAFTAHKEGSTRVPSDAVLLAENDACPVQAYRVGAGCMRRSSIPSRRRATSPTG